jgi:protein ImuB
MCVRLSRWSVDRMLRKRPKLRPEALVLVQTTASRQTIADLCPRAAAAGIRIGMTLAEARAICPGLQNLPHQPAQDQRALDALGRWLIRYVPIVSTSPPDSLFLDCTGCERLYGTLDELRRQVAAALHYFQIHARIAIAPTVGAAWALASSADSGKIPDLQNLPEILRSLPPAALRLDPDCSAMLSQLGVQTIGQLMNLPRNSLPARFGNQLLHRLDSALGKIPEPLVPLAYRAPIAADIQFQTSIDSLEILQQAIRVLIERLILQLTHLGCGARLLRLEFRRVDAPSLIQFIRLTAPSRNPAVLFNLLRCVLETVSVLPPPVRRIGDRSNGKSTASRPLTLHPTGADDGFISLHLSAPMVDRLTDAQLTLLEQEEQEGIDELGRLIEMLCAKLGSSAVVQPKLVESHLPEKSVQRVEPEMDRLCGIAKTNELNLPRLFGPRPLRLLTLPQRILAVVSPSDDGTGSPISFTHNGQVHRLRLSDGPERIAPLWWEGRDKTRDYFDVEDESGTRYWLFRVVQTGQWYLHGLFA